MKTKPFPYQREALDLSADTNVFALLMDLGTGKTKVALDTASHLYKKGEIDLLLVTTKRWILTQWIEEQIPEHLDCEHAVIEYQSTASRTKKYLDNLAIFRQYDDRLKIIVCTYGAFLNPSNLAELRATLGKYRVLWVLDESTEIKSHDAKRTKIILKLAPLAKYRRILTGAPVTHSVLDLWSQFAFLDTKIIGHSSYYTFRSEYAILQPIPSNWIKSGSARAYKGQMVTGFKHVDALKEKIRPYSFRVKLENMHGKTYVRRHVPMLPEQKRIYNEVLQKVRVELKHQNVLVQIDLQHAAAKLIKLQEVLCGHIYDEDGKLVEIETSRAEAAADVIEETSSPVIIFYWFRYDATLIRRTLDKRRIKFTTDPDKFKEENGPRVFIGQLASSSSGLNLQRASTTVFYTNSFNAGNRWQAEGRTYRTGQTQPCVFVDLVTPGSIDLRILENLKQKRTYADMIEDLRKYVSEV